jgi:GNAT superfamily N-acetyltransferase
MNPRAEFFAVETPLPGEFLGMTFPFLHARLRTRDPRISGIALLVDGAHAGLALAGAEENCEVEILSLGVVEMLRGRGFGTMLLQALEQFWAERGARNFRIAWDSALPTARALERVLAKRKWSEPRSEMQFAQITSAMVASSPWIARTIARLPPTFSVFPWQELSARDRVMLENIRGEVPPAFWPFDENETAPMDGPTSLGLRFQNENENEIAGWIITHRVAPELVRYTSLFVRPRWQQPHITFALLAEAMRRCPAAHGPAMRGALAARAENSPMMRLLERKFRPFATAWHEMRTAEKKLRPETAA